MATAVRRKLNELREEVAVFRRRHRDGDADLLESVIEDIARAAEDDENETLTRPEARLVTGYSAAQFRALERDGEIIPVPGEGPARFRKSDLLQCLTRKPRRRSLRVTIGPRPKPGTPRPDAPEQAEREARRQSALEEALRVA